MNDTSPKPSSFTDDRASLDTARFTDRVPDGLQCPICLGVPQSSAITECEHLFCRPCIQQWIAKSRQCPIDRLTLTTAKLRAAPRCLDSIVDGLRLRCRFHDRGCDRVVTVEQLAAHEASCPQRNAALRATCEELTRSTACQTMGTTLRLTKSRGTCTVPPLTLSRATFACSGFLSTRNKCTQCDLSGPEPSTANSEFVPPPSTASPRPSPARSRQSSRRRRGRAGNEVQLPQRPPPVETQTIIVLHPVYVLLNNRPYERHRQRIDGSAAVLTLMFGVVSWWFVQFLFDFLRSYI